METGGEFVIGIAFGELAAEFHHLRVILQIEHPVAQAEAGLGCQWIGRIEREE